MFENISYFFKRMVKPKQKVEKMKGVLIDRVGNNRSGHWVVLSDEEHEQAPICDYVMNDYGVGLLSLTPESGIGLLIQFQRPGQSKPHNCRTACLQV